MILFLFPMNCKNNNNNNNVIIRFVKITAYYDKIYSNVSIFNKGDRI